MTLVKCPTCGAGVAWTDASQYRPFCSRRCQITDLGDWAAERFQIAGTTAPNDIDGDDGDLAARVVRKSS